MTRIRHCPVQTCALPALLLALLTLAACGPRVERTGRSDSRRNLEPQATTAPPSAAGPVTAADLLPLIWEPERLVSAGSSSGVHLIEVLSCMREEQIDQIRCVCPDALRERALPAVRHKLMAAVSEMDEDDVRVTCRQAGEVSACTLPGMSECDPAIHLRFEAGTLVSMTFRDDWQSPEEIRELNDQRVDAALASACDLRCPVASASP